MLSLTCLTVFNGAFAQLTMRGGTLSISSNGILSTNTFDVVGGANLVNSGNLHVNDYFRIRNSTSVFTNSGNFYADSAAFVDSATATNSGLFSISRILRIKNGSNDQADVNFSSGALEFSGPNDKSLRSDFFSSLDLDTLRMRTAGANLLTLYSRVTTQVLELYDGKIDYASTQDSLIVNQGGNVHGGNTRSYAEHLYRIPTATGTDLYYPVGNTASANQFRPLELINITYDGVINPEIKVNYQENPSIPSYDSVGLKQVDFTNFWSVNDVQDTIDDFVARPSFRTSDVLDQNEAVVSQSENDGSLLFYNMGSANVSTSGDSIAIESEFTSTDNVLIAVGQATQINLQIRVFLGGALGVTPDTMENYLMANMDSTMRAIFEDGGTSKYPMLPGHPIPNSPSDAVDSIMIYLRTGISAATTVDSVSAWLMPDGSIKDFHSGTNGFVTFANAAPGSYYVVVAHRNHLAVMSSSAVGITTATPLGDHVDFGDIGQVYGAGAGDNGTVAFMWEGNANYDREVNAADLSSVEQAYGANVGNTGNDLGYTNNDVDLTNPAVEIQVSDYNRVIAGNNWIYFSAVPGI